MKLAGIILGTAVAFVMAMLIIVGPAERPVCPEVGNQAQEAETPAPAPALGCGDGKWCPDDGR